MVGANYYREHKRR